MIENLKDLVLLVIGSYLLNFIGHVIFYWASLYLVNVKWWPKLFLNKKPKTPLIKFPFNYIKQVEVFTEDDEEKKVAFKVRYEVYNARVGGFLPFGSFFRTFTPFFVPWFLYEWVFMIKDGWDSSYTTIHTFDTKDEIEALSPDDLIAFCERDIQKRKIESKKEMTAHELQEERVKILNEDFRTHSKGYHIEKC